MTTGAGLGGGTAIWVVCTDGAGAGGKIDVFPPAG